MSSRFQPLADPFAKLAAAPLPPPPAAPMSFDEFSCIGRLSARLVPALPAPCTLVCRHRGAKPREFWVTTSKAHFDAAALAHWPCMHGELWLLCVRAAQLQRSALAIGQWLIPREPPPPDPPPPDWRILGPLVWLLGAEPEELAPPRFEPTIAQALEHFDCELLGTDPDLSAAAASTAEGLL